jgi:hypothetical protein
MMRSVSGFVALGMCQVLEERGFGLICLGWSGSLDDVVHNRWSCLWTSALETYLMYLLTEEKSSQLIIAARVA